MQLKARTRCRDESLSELAEDIEHLVRLAYPEAADSMVEVLVKDQFVDALPGEDMRVRDNLCSIGWLTIGPGCWGCSAAVGGSPRVCQKGARPTSQDFFQEGGEPV